MTLQKIQHDADYKLHPNLLTPKQRRREVGELINVALHRLNNDDKTKNKQGVENDS